MAFELKYSPRDSICSMPWFVRAESVMPALIVKLVGVAYLRCKKNGYLPLLGYIVL